MTKIIFAAILFVISPLYGMELNPSEKTITLVASNGTEFAIDKNSIAQLSPIVKELTALSEGQEQSRLEFKEIKPAVLSFIVEAAKIVAPLEKVICEGKENELHFYPFKEVKATLEPVWQNKVIEYLKKLCSIPPLFQQRFKGELLRAANYLEIEPLKKYIAYKIAQELQKTRAVEVSKQLLSNTGYGFQDASAYKLIKNYFILVGVKAEEYTIADYIFEHGQPEKQIPNYDDLSHALANSIFSRSNLQLLQNKVISLQAKDITSLFGLSCLDMQDVVIFDLSHNCLTEIEKHQMNYLSNLVGLIFYNNYIQDIEPSSFSGLSKLLRLELSRNKIKQINSTLFSGLEQLQELMIHNAHIKDLEPNVFEKLSNLNVLSLHYNNLTQIKPDTFSGLTKLKMLDLSYNKIINLHKNSFNGLDALSYLNLKSNLFVKLQEGVFNGLPSLSNLDLIGNKLSSLGENIFVGLVNLRYLHLENDKLSVLPASFYTLKNVSILDW